MCTSFPRYMRARHNNNNDDEGPFDARLKSLRPGVANNGAPFKTWFVGDRGLFHLELRNWSDSMKRWRFSWPFVTTAKGLISKT